MAIKDLDVTYEHLPKQAAINSRTTPHICVVTHAAGHGTAEDLKCLLTDLADEGFSVTTSALGHGEHDDTHLA